MAEDLAALCTLIPLPLKDHKENGDLAACGPDFNQFVEYLETGPES